MSIPESKAIGHNDHLIAYVPRPPIGRARSVAPARPDVPARLAALRALAATVREPRPLAPRPQAHSPMRAAHAGRLARAAHCAERLEAPARAGPARRLR